MTPLPGTLIAIGRHTYKVQERDGVRALLQDVAYRERWEWAVFAGDRVRFEGFGRWESWEEVEEP